MFVKTKDELLSLATAIFLGVSLWLTMNSVAYGEPIVSTAQTKQVNRVELLAQANVSTSQSPFTSDEQARIIRAVVGQTGLSAAATSRRRVLTLVSAPDDKTTSSRASAQRLANATVYDYTAKQALLYRVNAANGQIISEQRLVGLPPLSQEERQESVDIIKNNAELAGLLAAGGVLHGGFPVYAPSGAPANNRYGLFNLLTSDHLRRQRVVYVDLTNGIVASSFIPAYQ